MTRYGPLRKLKVSPGPPVAYHLPLGEALIELNPRIGQPLTLDYQGEIRCIHCNRRTNRSFAQGHCYPCFTKLAACDMCILRPETCHHAQGTCREPDWAEQHCMVEHIVYLANSSGLKVGITRATQVPTRWIDQGASQAMVLLRVPTRHAAGLAEAELRNQVSDRTQWQTMLRSTPPDLDLQQIGADLLKKSADALKALCLTLPTPQDLAKEPVHRFEFPILEHPQKVKSLTLDRTPQIQGTLQGIKGQYLILDCGVLNVRKFAGYVVAATANES